MSKNSVRSRVTQLEEWLKVRKQPNSKQITRYTRPKFRD
jgi:hypothetical protein